MDPWLKEEVRSILEDCALIAGVLFLVWALWPGLPPDWFTNLFD